MNKLCKLCNNEFKTRNSGQLFCSRSCASKVKNGNKGRTFYDRECLQCKTAFSTIDKRKKFCNKSCAAKSNNSARLPMTEKQKTKISESLKKHFKLNPKKVRRGEDAAKAVGKSTRGKYRDRPPESILALNNRTVGKILRRLKIGCSVCGWDKCICDIHHINGRKIDDYDNHKNLTYVCPNCHRTMHNNLIQKEDIISLDNYVGEKWKDFYYG